MKRGILSAAAAITVFVGLALPVHAGGQVLGMDVSHHNGAINWSAAKSDDIRFAIVKATEGRTFVDSRYSRNRAAADAVGMPFTAYHFAQPDATTDDAIREADHFVNTARLKGRHLIPVLDLETKGTLGRARLQAWVRAWLARVESRLGVKPMIYTNPAFWIEHMGNSRWFADNGYRLWVAHWFVDQPRVPASNWGGRGWTVWQFHNCGSVDGIDGCVDLNSYRGSIAALRISNNR